MQFSYVKQLVESVAGEKVKDVIVTVPPFYTQAERDAVVDATEIAGLRTLALVNDGMAVAINYAMTRTFPEPEIHIIYDAGASAIRTTLVEPATDGFKGLFSSADSESTVLTDESTASEDMPRSLGLELTIPLTIDFEFGSTPPMTGKEKQAARHRLCEIDNIEGSKCRKEEARNNLENYLYKLGGESQTPFRRYSQSGARSAIQKKVEETLTWMDDEADDADMTQFLENLSSLESLERPIAHRYEEFHHQ
ncbi:hypothetical protein BDM02DRAFT_3273434 [Thelephora ganbajun]|uniref:Uncharacterized protein n=1 Tax=Thelephora ganbajun TaxID=370292 RepID=A0ACB6YZ54_THEGA|nr:hypothetical protein BDM02DRAFT_3273434 [Thelephora ganbajun]